MERPRLATPVNRRSLIAGTGGLVALAAADGRIRARQETDWLTADDLSQMPETAIRYWYYESPERTELGEQQVARFRELMPNIAVEGRTAPEAVDNEQLLAFIRAGTNSHVHQTVNNEDTWYIRHDLLQPLEELPGFAELWDRLEPRYNYTWRDGHVYSLSWYAEPRAMFYNVNLVREAGLDPEQPPTTYSEFLEWAAALTKENQWFVGPTIGEEWWWYQFIFYPYYIAATGSNQLHSEDGATAVFNTAAGLAPYELFNELYRNNYAALGPFESDPFLAGVVAAGQLSSNMLRTIQQLDDPSFEFTVGPIPKPDDAAHEGNPSYVFVRSFNLMREQALEGADATRTNRAAWEFMKFLLSPEQMEADFAVSGAFPPAADLLENELYAGTLEGYGEQGRWLADYGQEGFIYDMNTPYESESMAILQESWVKVARGSATPQEALDEAEARVNELLANPPAD